MWKCLVFFLSGYDLTTIRVCCFARLEEVSQYVRDLCFTYLIRHPLQTSPYIFFLWAFICHTRLSFPVCYMDIVQKPVFRVWLSRSILWSVDRLTDAWFCSAQHWGPLDCSSAWLSALCALKQAAFKCLVKYLLLWLYLFWKHFKNSAK